MNKAVKNKELKEAMDTVWSICKELDYGDPFSFARGKEIYTALALGHQVSSTLSGADAYLPTGEPVEYKSTTDKNPKGSYTGISVKPTWEQQDEYLYKKKIACYTKHFFSRYDGPLAEVWEMSGEDAYRVLKPKLKASYPTTLNKNDPRLSAGISWTDIKNFGKKVI